MDEPNNQLPISNRKISHEPVKLTWSEMVEIRVYIKVQV